MHMRLVLQIISVALLALLRSFSYCYSSNVVQHFTSCSRYIQCDDWMLKSTWTQGGYVAACTKESNEPDNKVLFKVFLTRNIYYCSNSTVDSIKIVNNYFDKDGRICHLSFGEDTCPSISPTSINVDDAWVKVALFCGKYMCQFQYHKCDICPLVPWYSWSIRRSFHANRKTSLSCRAQMHNHYGNKSPRSCFRCDGVSVSKRYCDSKARGGKYFVDVKESKPSWSEWESISGCDISSRNQSGCENNVQIGNMTWNRFCHYPNHPIRLDPKYCISSVGDTITRRCSVTTPQCSKSITTKRKDSQSKASNVWIAIIVIATIVLIVSMLCIFLKYNQLRSHSDTMFTATGIFSSCATQTSPKYSPRRIINEPEYALLGDWRQNVVQCPQPESKFSFGDSVYWGIEHDLLSDDDLNDVDSPVHIDATECCELDADSRRALYAKIHRW